MTVSHAAPRAAVALLLSLPFFLWGCGKGTATAGSPSGREAAAAAQSVDGAAAAVALPPEEPRAAELWARAMEGDADDLARLTGYVGVEGLVDAWVIPARHVVLLQALAFADDFTTLPFLAKVATTGTEEEATAALDTVASLAAAPRRATDPEDALEIHDGSVALLVLAKDVTRPPTRRARVVSALRLLASRGWVPLSEVPTDVDAR